MPREGIRLAMMRTWLEHNLEVVVSEKHRPSGLSSIQGMTSGDVKKIFVILNTMLGPCQIGPPFGGG